MLENEAVSLRSAGLVLTMVGLLAGCDQLGNPEQLVTGPTVWSSNHHELVTTTRSYRDPSTIRRLVEVGLEGFAHADPSVGPNQTLTLVTVAPRRLRPVVPGPLTLTTRFELPGSRVIERRWRSPPDSRHWSAAFVLPDAPVAATTSAEP